MIRHEFELTGVYVVLNDDVLKPEYRTPDYKVVKVVGGFGATPGLIGRTIYFRFIDGDTMAGGISYIDRYATHREIHRFAHQTNDTTCVMGDQCPSLEDAP